MMRAEYHDTGTNNPLIDALPEMMNGQTLLDTISSKPKVPPQDIGRRKSSSPIGLEGFFLPLDYMTEVYQTIYRLIRSTYYTRSSSENIRRTNALIAGDMNLGAYGTSAQSSAILGVAGIGKSSTIQRCLSVIPQVIEHEKYHNEIFFTKQVLWLYVTCPFDASAKTFCFNVVKALDEALGTNHLDYLLRIRSTASSAVVTYIKILCMTYNVGLIVVDEIQNLVVQAKRTNRIKPLIRFLTELTNDSATSIFFCGTELAETVFVQEEYLKRRTRGLRLLPFRPDGVYRDFLMELWKYQYTPMEAPLTDKMANTIYDLTGGIPAYIVKLFTEAQHEAISEGAMMIDEKRIRSTASRIALTSPKEYSAGIWLSDFKKNSERITEASESIEDNFLKTEPEKRLYANTRGRRAAERDSADLIIAFREERIMQTLTDHDLFEEVFS